MSLVEREKNPRREHLRLFTVVLALVAAFVAALPSILAYIGTPRGESYLGYQYNTDDHMVYSAWMRQAVDGRFFMDNRFTTDPQPGQTVHIYFYLLGLLAKVTGIPLAAFLARVVFSVLFVLLLGRLVHRLRSEVYTYKLSLSLAVIGGGLGFLVWHNFGQAIVKPVPELLASQMLGRLPTDVWQPEGFVYPSMLTNSLFMVSLCLIVYAFTAFIDARESWRPVAGGTIAMGVLMNIHSYDVLLVAVVMVGFLAMSLMERQATAVWILRAVVIGAGVVPAALWFMHVLEVDKVFQSRAATETFSPNFRQVFFGYLPMIALAFTGMAMRPGDGPARNRRLVGLGVVGLEILILYVLAENHSERYFMDPLAWGVAFVVALAGLVLMADERPVWNLMASWAVLGLVALYFPALFQRKLAMGLSIPWCVLAAFGVQKALAAQERSARNLATVLVLVMLGATSLRWFMREIMLARWDVSNTTVHPVYLSHDAVSIRDYLNGHPGKKVVVAPPGLPATYLDPETKQPMQDVFAAPLMPDLNPILSGLTGAYTYAGHWSETPDYLKRRGVLESLYYRPASSFRKEALLESTGADYVVAPVPEAFDSLNPPDLRFLGDVVFDGSQFRLIKVNRTK